MNIRREDLLLYAVTDRSWLGSATLCEQVEEALKGGASMVQLREKELDEKSFREEALMLKELCRRYQVPFVINDNVALAREIDADGVHVGQSDLEAGEVRKLLGPDKIIGVTAKTVEQARAARAHGADYIGSGAVFGSSTKSDAKSMSIELLREIAESVDIPVVAIGGIHKGNLAKLQGSKIAGAAIVSGIFAQPDIREACEELVQILKDIISISD